MKNLITSMKISMSILILLSVSFSFFAFNDSGEYVIKGNVIMRSSGAMYQVGVMNIKFRKEVSGFTKNTMGISNIDKVFSDISVINVWQMHPLKSDFKKRMIGDEELAKVFQIKYDRSIDPMDAAAMILRDNKDVLDWAEPSFVYKSDYVPNDPAMNTQWHIQKINSYQAWDLNKGDTSVVIGIVDSGSDLDHPDLAANMKRNWLEIPGNGIDDDANGYIDDYKGWDFYANDNDPQIQPAGNTHGSHVSGCASQVTDNTVHGAGIGFKVKLLISKHTDDTNPESLLYNTDNGIVYCYQNGAKVINCSYGTSSYASYTQLVCTNAWNNGTIICASAGNGDANGIGQNWARYPASYNNVVSVAASSNTDVKTIFSNFHSTVDITGPGQDIISTIYNNNYTNLSGTSMSSPIVAGTVALIRSKYPAWTVQQVYDRLLLGVDSIYTLNPTYVGLLGTGRVNAFKCLSDLPIVRLVTANPNDSIYGNNDKVFDVDEIIALQLNLKNTHFAGSNASLRLTTTSTDVQIVQDSVYVGSIGAYANFSTALTNTFKVKALSSCAFDKDIIFKVKSSASCYTDDNANTFTVRFRQGFAVHSANNMKLCLTKDGNVGKKAQSYGSGLQIGSGTTNYIYEGGLMIGTSNTKVSDVVRRSLTPANASDTDFVALRGYALTTPGVHSAQDGIGKFNDDGAGSNKIGVEVEAYSYEFTTSQDMNYVLVQYKIKNTSGAALSNVYAGLFTWMSPEGFFNSGNISRLSTANKLAYTYNTGYMDKYIGVGLMTNQTMNFKIYPSTDLLNGFTTQEKWDGLSSGVVNDSLGPNGNGYVLGVGPFNLAVNQVETIGFAVLYGTSAADLIAKNIQAKTKYNTVGVNNISTEVPKVFSLSQNYPNPFNPTTNIMFGVPKNSMVTIKVYDLLGREVAVLLNEQKQAGTYQVDFNAASLSSGVYFYRMEAGTFADIKRMVVIK